VVDRREAFSCVHATLAGSATVRPARHAPPIRMTTTILHFGFRGVKVTSPFVEFLADGVEPPPMICGAETLLVAHSRDPTEPCRVRTNELQIKQSAATSDGVGEKPWLSDDEILFDDLVIVVTGPSADEPSQISKGRALTAICANSRGAELATSWWLVVRAQTHHAVTTAAAAGWSSSNS